MSHCLILKLSIWTEMQRISAISNELTSDDLWWPLRPFEAKIRKLQIFLSWNSAQIQKFRFRQLLWPPRLLEAARGLAMSSRRRHIHTIRKVKFLSKNSILTTPQHFHELFLQIFFWQFFSWNQSCQQLKSPKPQHFHEFFTQIFFDNFSREIKVVNS